VSRNGLIGSTGFVGGALARSRKFDRAYDSNSINEIAGDNFDMVVCAGAPATMWAANSQPEADAANLARLFEALRSADIGRLVLISTIAVLDDASAGYTETTAKFEVQKAYGRNRRDLELRGMNAFDCYVLRLPALFGPGLKKNFVFDLMNPVPSFVSPAKFDELTPQFRDTEQELLTRAFAYDAGVRMWKFDRGSFGRSSVKGRQLEAAFRRVGFLSRAFTNSESRFQFYNIERLADDIDTCLERGLRTLNVCSEPMTASYVHEEIVGEPFANATPALVAEDVRSEHAALFGSSGPYLYARDLVLQELKAFVSSEIAA
jgi:hypothetical protein